MSPAPFSLCRVLAAAFGLAGLAAAPALGAPDTDGAVAVFHEAKVICDRDGGALWGRSLCGPMLLVDPNDRAIAANQADGGGVLKASGSIFTGIFPESENVANTPTEWSGVRWTQILWPLPASEVKRHVLIAHELFHRIQPYLNLSRPEAGNQHLDTLEGRYLLQLEWRALGKALGAPTTAGRRAAIADALLFRRERYRLFPQAATEEGALEINEGIPEYTGVRLGIATALERRGYAVYDLSAFVQAPTFVRSFAYATGPAYGLLLDQADPAWRGKLGSGQRLDQLLSSALRLPAPAFVQVKARQAAYDDGRLRTREVKRDQERQSRLAALKARLVDGPVLMLPLHHSNYQFNPQTLQPLGEFGTVYPSLRLTADWGVLEVDYGGALLDKDMATATVSAAGIDPSSLKGDGWRLILNKGWILAPGSRKGDLVAKRGGAVP